MAQQDSGTRCPTGPPQGWRGAGGGAGGSSGTLTQARKLGGEGRWGHRAPHGRAHHGWRPRAQVDEVVLCHFAQHLLGRRWAEPRPMCSAPRRKLAGTTQGPGWAVVSYPLPLPHLRDSEVPGASLPPPARDVPCRHLLRAHPPELALPSPGYFNPRRPQVSRPPERREF